MRLAPLARERLRLRGGGADGEVSLARNREAYAGLALVPSPSR